MPSGDEAIVSAVTLFLSQLDSTAWRCASRCGNRLLVQKPDFCAYGASSGSKQRSRSINVASATSGIVQQSCFVWRRRTNVFLASSNTASSEEYLHYTPTAFRRRRDRFHCHEEKWSGDQLRTGRARWSYVRVKMAERARRRG